MTAALPTLRRSQSSAYAETTSRIGGRRPTARFVDFDIERSSEARRRHRVIASARHLAALFEHRSDHGQRAH